MRKLKLEVEQLKVESLVVEAENGHRGTVNGQQKVMPSADPRECDTGYCGGGGGGGGASYEYGCPTMGMLDPACANYTGVLACG
jgi:hypothetical protein